MSESYEINGVTISPAAGGYYDINHKSLNEPERVRGKEKAEQRAVEIAKAAEGSDPEGHIPPQGDLSDLTPAERAQETEAVYQGTMRPEDTEAVKDPKEAMDAKDEKIAALEAGLTDMSGKFEQLLKMLQPVVRTVEQAEGEPESAVPLTISRTFDGDMDKDSKAALKKAGIGVTRIVLEEGETIPPTGLFIGHNGRSYVIKPGEEVDVPDFLLGVLDDAVMSAPITDSKTQKVLGYRNRSKYPYRKV